MNQENLFADFLLFKKLGRSDDRDGQIGIIIPLWPHLLHWAGVCRLLMDHAVNIFLAI